MPFLDDIDSDDEALRRPVWGVFALVKDNLERVVMANIGWASQLLPAIGALAFPQLPTFVRVFLVLYSALMLTPATGLLYAWMARVNQGEMLRLEMLREDFRHLLVPSLLCLAPLFGLLGICYTAILALGLLHLLLLDVLTRFALLVLLICSVYWGPLFAEYPEKSSFFILRQSLLLVWNYPGQTAVTTLIVLLVAALGITSIAGFFLLAPAVVALLQTRRCFSLLARQRARQKSFKVGTV